MKTFLGVLALLAIGAGAYYFMRNNPQNSKTENSAYNQNDSQQQKQTQQPAGNTDNPTGSTSETPVPDKAVASFETSEGSFEVTLDGKAAPKTVANFIKLANQGFYNNLSFHRIVAGFMIQGGDPKGDGTGGPGYTVPAEIGLKHTKGAIAMARTGDAVNPKRESSGSQFYITLEEQPGLDGQYTVFGYVTKGMDIVTKIGSVQTEPNPFSGENSVPVKDVLIKKITIKE